jgi:hypothetical protein
MVESRMMVGGNIFAFNQTSYANKAEWHVACAQSENLEWERYIYHNNI